MKLIESIVSLADITASQWGLVTSAQAKAKGLSNMDLSRLVKEGVLERLAHGVYKDVSAPSGPHEQIRVAWLAIEPEKTAWARTRKRPSFATVAGESAALVHGLGNLRGMKSDFITQGRKQTQRDDVRYRNKTLVPEDVTVVAGLPVLTIERMVADLVELRVPLPHVGEVVRDAMRGTDIQVDLLTELLDPLSQRYGFPKHEGSLLLHAILKTVALDAESVAERVASDATLGKLISEKYMAHEHHSAESDLGTDQRIMSGEHQNVVSHAALLLNISRLYGEPLLNKPDAE